MRHKFLALFFGISLLFIACTNKDGAESGIENNSSVIETKELAKDYIQEPVGKIINTKEGQRTVVKTLYDIDEIQVQGPFKITIRDVRLSQFQPHPEKISEYGGDDLGLLSIHLKVENTCDETAIIYPSQGAIETDTGKKMDAHFSLSHDVDGEFEGRSARAGEVYCIFNGQAADITHLTYHIEAAHDKKLNSLGNDFEFLFYFN